MATISTIGTSSRNYSTIQAWEDAIPATPTGGYEGQCYNDSEFTAGVLISGHTGGSTTNYIKLTAASGQSFQDNANKATNALFYSQSNGVGIAANPFAQSVIEINNEYVTITRLQVKRTGTSYTRNTISVESTFSGTDLIKDCILAKTQSQNVPNLKLRDEVAVNCLCYDNGSTGGNGIEVTGASALAKVINCTVVRIGTAAGTGIIAGYTGNVVQNTAVFGFTTAFSTAGSWGASSGYNATDAASAPGSNNQVSKTYANQFVSTTNDFRIKAAADLINHGNTDATNAPNDIIGTLRGSTTAGDIGAWEDPPGFTTTSFSFVGGATFTPDSRMILNSTVSFLAAATCTVNGAAGTQTWRVPTNAPDGTAAYLVIFSGTPGTLTINTQGSTVASGGYFTISAAGVLGDKKLAFVHNWDGSTITSSIYGGPGIGTVV